MPVEEFCTGFRLTALAPGELVRSISVRKLGTARRGIFLKLGLRKAQAISVISVAVVVEFDGPRVVDARIALGCVAPTIVRIAAAEASLAGSTLDRASRARAAALAAAAIAPIDDIRATAGYRRTTIAALVERALDQIADGTEANALAPQPVLLETLAAAPEILPYDGTVVDHDQRPRIRTDRRAASLAARRPARTVPVLPVRRKAAPRVSAARARCGSTAAP